jgi:2-polyprenyl-6-hydroxyphenyl methylase/3-demethylubiquinone-9 3-methyltransferase|tara:strand:- start:2112 stop:2840 length:729 start_codon:yes stop_codon:yes gene_type:complete
MKTTTINKEEIDKFSKIADEWWDPDGKFKPLHAFNPIRIKYIKDNIIKHFKIEKKILPLSKLKILDIGCGGGLIAEPMTRLGASVTGIDASEKNIKIAKAHLRKNKLKINYKCASPENFIYKEKFDVILNLEIVEHVEDLELFIKKSSRLLKKGGLMYVATINKTLKSYLFAIIGAEYVLRWLPIGTHDWEKFVEPSTLISFGEKNFLKLNKIDGMKFDIISNYWKLSEDKSINYIAEFRKI